MKKMGQKNQSRLFLLSFNSKLSHFDKNLNFNLNLNHTNLKKTDVVLIYRRGPSTFRRQIYSEKFPQRILPSAGTFVNVVQHLRDFGRFEMNERDLGRQREDRILVAEEEILHEIDSVSRCKFKTPLRKFVKTEIHD
jgi:hypothetical protein